MRRLILTLAILAAAALPALAQTPEIGTRTGGGGTWENMVATGACT
jgi:hypothetical protein